MSRFYWILFWLLAVLLNENVVQWALAIWVGGYSVSDGFDSAFKFFTPLGYAFFTLFRMIPYVILAKIIDRSSDRKIWATRAIAWGGLAGIVSMIVWGSWVSLHSLYTDAHASSTTAIAFLFIPVWAILTGFIGSLLGVLVAFVGRKLRKPA